MNVSERVRVKPLKLHTLSPEDTADIEPMRRGRTGIDLGDIQDALSKVEEGDYVAIALDENENKSTIKRRLTQAAEDMGYHIFFVRINQSKDEGGKRVEKWPIVFSLTKRKSAKAA